MTGGSESGPSIGPSYRRYRRRILGWGAVVLAAVFAVGAALTLGRVEDDLADRVVEVIDEQGIAGVRVTFSGQDGTLDCAQPFGDPEAMSALAADVRGVRSIDLEDTCVSSTGSEGGTDPDAADGTTDADGDEAEATAVTAPEPSGSPDAATSATTADGDVRTVMDALAADPQFSAVLNAAEAAGLTELVDQVEPFTAFAPSNAAFDQLSPQVAGALNADPALLDAVLQNHVALGVRTLDELVSGPLDMVGGATVLVDADASPPTVTSGSIVGAVTDGDIEVAEGVVHVIDQLLIPPDLGLATTVGTPELDVTFEGGALTLEGAVMSDDDRELVVDAAEDALADTNVVDRLEVTAAADAPAADPEATAIVAELLPTATTSLASGTVGVLDEGVTVAGVVVDDDARAAIEDVASALGAAVELRDRPVVGEGDLIGAAADDAVLGVQDTIDAILAETPLEFASADYEPTDDHAAALDRVAAAVKSLGGTTVLVEGHTTASGNADADFLLSRARAATIADELVARGVPAEQLELVARSATDPGHRVTFVVEAS